MPIDILALISQTLNALTATGFLPFILFVIAIIAGVKIGDALRYGLMAGIGFFGMMSFMAIGAQHIAPYGTGISQKIGIPLEIPDVTVALPIAIAWGCLYAGLIMPLGVLFNFIFLALRLTKTIDVDLWNYFQYSLYAYVVYVITGNFLLGILAWFVIQLITFVIADKTASFVQKEYGLPYMSMPHPHFSFNAIIAYPFKLLFDRIKLPEIDTATLRKKIGPFGDTVVIGFIIGLILGILAGFDWIGVIREAVILSAICLILPRMIGILVAGLTPIADALTKKLRQRFPGKEFYIGVDAALGAAHPDCIIASVVLIPIIVATSFVLPGNMILPMVSLGFVGWIVNAGAMFWRRNFIANLIYGWVVSVIWMYMATFSAPFLTMLAKNVGFAIPAGAKYVASFFGGGYYWDVVLLAILKALGLAS